MPVSFINYKLNEGYIDNWLVAGPQIENAFPQPEDKNLAQFKDRIFQANFLKDSGITEMPVERGPLKEGVFQIGSYEGAWSYWHCEEDHLVNHSLTVPTYAFLRSWAYTQIQIRKAIKVNFMIDTYGPISVWINEKCVFQTNTIGDLTPRVGVEVNLIKGVNEVLVRFEQVGAHNLSHAVSTRICTAGSTSNPVYTGKIRIPTTIPHVSRRNELEHGFQYGYLTRDIYSSQSAIEVQWVNRKYKSAVTHVRLQTDKNRIYSEATDKGRPGDTAYLHHAMSIPEGPYKAVLMPVPREMYDESIRIDRSLDLWVVGNHQYSTIPTGNLEERKANALKEASTRSGNLFAEIAKMAAGRWDNIELTSITGAVEHAASGRFDSAIDLLGLLGMVDRFGDEDLFPKDLHPLIQNCAISYRYSVRPTLAVPYLVESDQFVRLTCKLLASQRYPESVFKEDDAAGSELLDKVQTALADWLLMRGQEGFEQWDSDQILTDTLMALSYLIDLADSDLIFDLAGILFDKILVGIAVNTFKGGISSSRGYGSTLDIKGAVTQAISGITRLFWGQGIYNHHLVGYVSAALLKNYQMPFIVADLALTNEIVEGKERHHDANKATYRTKDFMLSSTQDYKPGSEGNREHIWQATLGPEAVVFTNHPGSASQNDSLAPNFWLGNAVLPRVCQLRDFLIAIYNITDQTRMGYTHAYFPTFAFDEYKIRKNWAFACKEDGYLALTASSRMDLAKSGSGAFRELKVSGSHTIWLCQMGAKEIDGDFNQFQKKIFQIEPIFDGLRVELRTLRDKLVSFGWQEPLIVDEEKVQLDFQNHYDYPAVYAELPATQMDVLFNDHLLRLNLNTQVD